MKPIKPLAVETFSDGEAALIRDIAGRSTSLVEAYHGLCLSFTPRLTLLDKRSGSITIHHPAQDGASGLLGHIGTCIGRISE